MEPYIEYNKLLTFIKNKDFLNFFIKLCINNGINPKKSKLIDLGCGQGDVSISLSRFFYNVYGIDPSDHMLKYARNLKIKVKKEHNMNWKGLNRLRFYKGDFNNIPINNVDVICLFNSIHFSKNLNSDLKNILTYLKQNGILYINEPTKYFGSKELMNNKTRLEKKIKHLKNIKKQLKLFIKNNNSIHIILEKELEKQYILILKKK